MGTPHLSTAAQLNTLTGGTTAVPTERKRPPSCATLIIAFLLVSMLVLAEIPVHAFVGALDTTVPPERPERMIAAIKKAGGREAKLKIYPAEGHGAGRIVVASAEYYDWLFSNQRDLSPPPLTPTEAHGSKPSKPCSNSSKIP